MKFLIVVLTLVGTMSLWEVNAYYMRFIRRVLTESPTNDILYTANQTGSVEAHPVELKKTIDADNPLLLTAKVTNSFTGEEVYSGKDLNVCTHYDRHDWAYIAVELFNGAMMPEQRRKKCPFPAQQYTISSWVNDMISELSDAVPSDDYEISYTAKSVDDELVFSALKFVFELLY